MPSYRLFGFILAICGLAQTNASHGQNVLYGNPSVSGPVVLERGIPSSTIEPAVPTGLPDEVIEQRLQALPNSAFDKRASDEIWLISSRHLCSRHASIESLDVKKRVNGSHWKTESVHSLLGPDPTGMNRPIVVFVHGNRWPLDKAIRRGLQTYDQTIFPWRDAPSLRFVIWTWPSDAIPGPIRDVKTKASKADQHAFHFARFLQSVAPPTPLSVVGYSYGGRVSLGALHLMGGGRIDGYHLSNAPPAFSGVSQRINLTLVVPAIRNNCLIGTRAQAYSQINRLFLVYNNRDRYLNLFKFTRFGGKNPALGYTGVCGLSRLPDHTYRVDQFNASRAVGTDHDFLEYISDQRIETRLRAHLLLPAD
ncbi:alpha/beta hydrolase family protein [Rhodopirellula sallentina]|uniref:Putative secreted protein n=1 Tax=Rhodopirellula sallentina SM41 TaxID=1263870 RepID=M5U6U6_9BACT|nr:alpha/beta hydrolase [Rhodopirellula sallentina]EMI53601.1 putative secreted protein [Rhodopirellula sallentina SM41]